MKKQETPEELVARLQSTPYFVAGVRDHSSGQRCVPALPRPDAQLLADLRVAGFAVNSASDLVDSVAPYTKALPILFDHLPRPYPAHVREGIARALAVPAAKFGWNVLTKVYRRETDKGTMNALALAIAATSDDDVIEEVIALARDPKHGASRLVLLCALERSKSPRARGALMSLGTDPELWREIQLILQRAKTSRQ